MKFRKKPIVIEAVQFLIDHGGKCNDDVIGPLVDGWVDGNTPYINTLEGRMTVSPGDWIITGVKGEKYPCKPDIFEAIYEPVSEGKPTIEELESILASKDDRNVTINPDGSVSVEAKEQR